jgi:hypothetical protein
MEVEHAVAVAPLAMMRVVPEDVREAVVHFAGGPKIVTVVTIDPHAALST